MLLVKVEPDRPVLQPGEKTRLGAQVRLADGQVNANVIWSSSDDGVATVNRASGEARVGADAMSRVAGVSTNARGTASEVKVLADAVALEAEGLEAEVRRFLNDVQAA